MSYVKCQGVALADQTTVSKDIDKRLVNRKLILQGVWFRYLVVWSAPCETLS